MQGEHGGVHGSFILTAADWRWASREAITPVGSVLTGVGSWRQDLVLRAVAGVFVGLEQEMATGSGRLLLYGVVVCFSEVQTWPLRVMREGEPAGSAPDGLERVRKAVAVIGPCVACVLGCFGPAWPLLWACKRVKI